MQLSEIINTSRIKGDVDVSSKKRALEELSQLLTEGETQLSASRIFDSLISRERLGSTGVGYGVAIPHGRIKNCQHITGAFVHLQHGVDFDAIDDVPVDLLFALIVPEESTDEHLQVLATLSSMFNDSNFRNKLRKTTDPQQIRQIFSEWKQADT